MAQVEPLRDRFPIYLKGFGLGTAAALVAALIVFLVSSAGLAASVGYSFLGLGTIMLLVGGGRGGGYGNLGLGALGTLARGYRDRGQDGSRPAPSGDAGRAAAAEEDYGLTPYSPQADPMERLRRGLRPPANPTAFWQVVGGALYLGLGVLITTFLV